MKEIWAKMEWDEKKAVKGSKTYDGEVKGGEGGDSGQTLVTVVMFPCLPVCPFLMNQMLWPESNSRSTIALTSSVISRKVGHILNIK